MHYFKLCEKSNQFYLESISPILAVFRAGSLNSQSTFVDLASSVSVHGFVTVMQIKKKITKYLLSIL